MFLFEIEIECMSYLERCFRCETCHQLTSNPSLIISWPGHGDKGFCLLLLPAMAGPWLFAGWRSLMTYKSPRSHGRMTIINRIGTRPAKTTVSVHSPGIWTTHFIPSPNPFSLPFSPRDKCASSQHHCIVNHVKRPYNYLFFSKNAPLKME